jgi:hypothetical protein
VRLLRPGAGTRDGLGHDGTTSAAARSRLACSFESLT